ncbi:MAG TPA: hypothetical protein VLM85_31795 [Polyangiaceae bacterium]|nr:hypothetical protein [Polyangiaceae bacterium]
MSQPWTPIPVPQQGMPPAPYPVAPPQKPSTFYKVVGILQLVFGIGGALWTLVSLAMTALATTISPSGMAMYDPPTLAFIYVHTGFGLVTGGLLAATGFGVVRAKRWARPVGLVYAALSLGSTLVGTGVQLLVVLPKMYGRMPSAPISENVQLFSTVSTIVGALVVSVPPIFTAIVLLRPSAKQELDG